MSNRAFVTAARTVAAAAVLAGGLTVATPGTALATRGDCERGAHGFVDISETQEGSAVVPSIQLRPGAIRTGTIHLKAANISGKQRGFAQIINQEPGDEFWMDWTQDNEANWVQCGPFISPDYNPHTTAAKETNVSTSWKFRACGSAVGSNEVKCTRWW